MKSRLCNQAKVRSRLKGPNPDIAGGRAHAFNKTNQKGEVQKNKAPKNTKTKP